MSGNKKITKAIYLFKEAEDFFNKNNPKKAEPLFLSVVGMLENNQLEEKNLKYLINSYKYLGNIYYTIFSDWNKAQRYLIKYLSYDKKISFAPEYYYKLAYCFRQNADYELSYKNFRRAYKLTKIYNNLTLQVLTLNEISNYYYYTKKFKSAIKLKKIALNILKKSDKKIKRKEYLYSILYNDLAETYSKIGEKKKAWENFERSMKFKTFGLRAYEDNFTYINAVIYAVEAGDMDKAKTNLDILSHLKDNFNKETLSEYYRILSYYYEMKKEYKKAIEFHKKYFETKKKYFEKINEKDILELQSKYEVEKKNQEKEIFRIENIELKNINISKDKFFSIIAHDLRSPFATIYSFISLMKRHHKNLSKEKIMELVSELEQIVTNTYSLLENLLEWSRMQSGIIVYQPTKINTVILISNVISLIHSRASQKNIKIVNEITKPYWIFADGFMIRTILRNLLNNAIKFTESGGKIVVKQKKDNDFLKIFIIDSGIGMSQDIQKKLFKLETSFSTNGTNHEKGTGLGLILCKEFIKKNKGDIFVESEKGKGSTFYFTLPLLNQNGMNKNAKRE